MSGPVVRYLVDSNVLLRSIEAGHPHQTAARNALAWLPQIGSELCMVPQSLIEFWGVATRPSSVRSGLGITPAQAQAAIGRFQTAMPVLLDTPAIFGQWQRLAITYKVEGKQVHDTRLAAAMLVHGLTHILTFNGKDFTRFASEGITPIAPTTITVPPPQSAAS